MLKKTQDFKHCKLATLTISATQMLKLKKLASLTQIAYISNNSEKNYIKSRQYSGLLGCLI